MHAHVQGSFQDGAASEARPLMAATVSRLAREPKAKERRGKVVNRNNPV
jgi:hypothetical protein